MHELSLQASRTGPILAATAAVLVAGLAAIAVPHPAVLVAIGLAPIAGILTFRMPFLLCLAFVVFSFFRIHEAFPVLNPLRIPQLLAMGTLAVISVRLATGRIVPFWSRQLGLFAIFFGLITVGVLAATNRDISMAYWSQTFVKIAAMVLAIAWLTRGPAEFRLAYRSFIGAGMAVAMVALANSANGVGLVEGTRVTIGRDIGSVLGDPNDLSLVLLFPLSFAAAVVLTRGTGIIDKLYGCVGAGTVMAAIVATQSRGGLLGIVAVFGTFAMRRIRSRLVLAVGGVIGLAVLSLAAGIGGRASGGAGESGIDESSMGRLHAWQAAIRMALARPFTGVGIDNYVQNYFYYSDWWEGFAKAVHSTWFSVLAEGGFIAFAVFVTLIVSTMRSALRSVRQLAPVEGHPHSPPAYAMAQAIVAGIVGFIVSGTFLTQGFTWPLYILLALAVAVARNAAETTGRSARRD
ncbi:membrane protein [Allostella sp. ATCC 35155]|nr:membrane protein [Stella sp. ATCC 35155]